MTEDMEKDLANVRTQIANIQQELRTIAGCRELSGGEAGPGGRSGGSTHRGGIDVRFSQQDRQGV